MNPQHVTPSLVELFHEFPPRSAFTTEQSEASRDDHEGVIRVWLSSIRPHYRRAVHGRSNFGSAGAPVPRGRHRAA